MWYLNWQTFLKICFLLWRYLVLCKLMILEGCNVTKLEKVKGSENFPNALYNKLLFQILKYMFHVYTNVLYKRLTRVCVCQPPRLCVPLQGQVLMERTSWGSWSLTRCPTPLWDAPWTRDEPSSCSSSRSMASSRQVSTDTHTHTCIYLFIYSTCRKFEHTYSFKGFSLFLQLYTL
jgi:hypothetical protein